MAMPPEPTRRLTGDLALGLAAAVLMVLGTSGVSARGTPPSPQGWLLLLAAAAVLVFRRRWPTAVMWTAIACGLAYSALGNPGAFYTVAIGIGIYSVAATGHRMAAVAGLAGAFGLFLAADLVLETGHLMTGGGALWFLGWLTVALLLGEVSRSRSDYIAAVQERAVEAERSRQEYALRRAGEERMQIARDLHDVLAHSISIINVQAGAALHHLDTDPDKAQEALLTVRETGKRALRELRSSIGVLRRADDRPDGDEQSAPRRPSPGIEDLESLVETTRRAGLHVELLRQGNPQAVVPQVGLAAYRIIQESLTNVARHAGATTATVTISHRPHQLVLRVDDDGRGAPTEVVDGHGIDGMRERVAALRGVLQVGSRPGGGFRVEARIPLADPA
jgi:MYXO-CTERM domain-containing protein